MDYINIKEKYPFLSDIDCYNLYIISKFKISYDEIKCLKKKDLIYYTKNYVKKAKIVNKNSRLNLNPYITPEDIDTLFNYKKHGISDLKLNKMLLSLEKVKVLNKPDTKSIFKMIKLFKTTNFFVLTICLTVFIFSFLSFTFLINDGIKTDKISGNIITNLKLKEVVPNKKDVNIISDDYFKYLDVSMLDVNFNELKHQNSDTKGWIKVNGTNINYPFVQYKDNDYY